MILNDGSIGYGRVRKETFDKAFAWWRDQESEIKSAITIDYKGGLYGEMRVDVSAGHNEAYKKAVKEVAYIVAENH